MCVQHPYVPCKFGVEAMAIHHAVAALFYPQPIIALQVALTAQSATLSIMMLLLRREHRARTRMLREHCLSLENLHKAAEPSFGGRCDETLCADLITLRLCQSKSRGQRINVRTVNTRLKTPNY